MSFKYFNEVRKLDVEALVDFLNDNGYGEFRQILRVKGIDGDKFLNLTEFDIMRWKPLGINTKKLWSCINQLKQNPQNFMNEQNTQNQMDSSQTYDNLMKPSSPLIPLPPQKLPISEKPKLPPLPKSFLPPSPKFQVLPPPPPSRSQGISPPPPSRAPQTLPTPPKVFPTPPRLQILTTPPRLLQEPSSPSPPTVAKKSNNLMSSLKPQLDELNTYLQMENLANRFEKKENDYLMPINNGMNDDHHDDNYEPIEETPQNFPTSIPHFANIKPKMKPPTPTKATPISLRPPQTLPRSSDASYIAPDDMDDEDADSAPPSDEVYEPSPEVPLERFNTEKTTSRKALPELPTEDDDDTYEPTPGSLPLVNLVVERPREKPPLPQRNFQMTKNTEPRRKMSPRIYENTEVEMEQMLLDDKDDSFSKRILNFFKSPISKRYKDETRQAPPELNKAESPELDLEEYENITMPVSKNESIFNRPLPGLPVQKSKFGIDQMVKPNTSIEPMMEPNAGIEPMKQMMKSYDRMEETDASMEKMSHTTAEMEPTIGMEMMKPKGGTEKMMKPNAGMVQMMKPSGGMEQMINKARMEIMKPKAGMEQMMKTKAGMEQRMKHSVGMEMMKPKSETENMMKKPNAGMEQIMNPSGGMEQMINKARMEIMKPKAGMEQMMKHNADMGQMTKPDTTMKQVMRSNEGVKQKMKINDGMKKIMKPNELSGNESEMVVSPTSPSSPVYGNHDVFKIPDAIDISVGTVSLDTDEEFDNECESPSIYENKETLTTQDTTSDRGELIKKLSLALNLRNRPASQDVAKNERTPVFNLPPANIQVMSEDTTLGEEKPEAMTKSMPELNSGKLDPTGRKELMRKLSLALSPDNKRMSKDFADTEQMNVSQMDDSLDDDPIYGNDPENASITTSEMSDRLLNMPNFPSSYDHHYIASEMKECHKMLPVADSMTPPEFSDDELEEYDTIVYNLNSEPFFRNTDRKGAKLYLEGQNDGVYLIRPSRNNKEFDLALNIKYQTKIFNMGISKLKNQYHYQCEMGLSKDKFSSLHDLIEHFKMHPLHFNYKNRVTEIFLTHTLPSDLV